MQSGIPNDEYILLFPQIPCLSKILSDIFRAMRPKTTFWWSNHIRTMMMEESVRKWKSCEFIVRNWYINWSKTGSKNTNTNSMKKWVSWSRSWNGSFVCVEQSERLTERARECNKSRREMHILLFEHRKNKQSQLFEVEKLRLE